MQLSTTTKGILFALSGAALNGTIGTLSKTLIAIQVDPAWIAFLKTALGFVVIWLVLQVARQNYQSGRWYTVLIAAFFGIFALFYFETLAYQYMSTANVVVILMASAAVTANLAGWLLLRDKPTGNQWFGMLMAIVGIAFIIGVNVNIRWYGIFSALSAGFGYGLFTVLLKKFNLKGGLILTRQLMLWGVLFLWMPAIQKPFMLEPLLSTPAVIALLGLAILPSVLGFFCITRAVDYLSPSRVQLLGLSEPAFAAMIAFFVLGESVHLSTWIGAIFVLCGIYYGCKTSGALEHKSDESI